MGRVYQRRDAGALVRHQAAMVPRCAGHHHQAIFTRFLRPLASHLSVVSPGIGFGLSPSSFIPWGASFHIWTLIFGEIQTF